MFERLNRLKASAIRLNFIFFAAGKRLSHASIEHINVRRGKRIARRSRHSVGSRVTVAIRVAGDISRIGKTALQLTMPENVQLLTIVDPEGRPGRYRSRY